MTEQDKEIEELRRRVSRLENTLRAALSDLIYVLDQHSLCDICKYVDADCKPDNAYCVPKWRGLSD